MAELRPFRGICYNTEKVCCLSKVTTPPYDVISESQQGEFYDNHPNNIIRLELAKRSSGDSEDNNPHTRAAKTLCEWTDAEILCQDAQPALYLTAVEFTVNGQTITRYGIIGRVGLEPFDRGVVLPHERTFSKVKSERLGLMKACEANFSPIFSLFSDTGNILSVLIQAADSEPDSDFSDAKGHRHRLWRIIDPAIHQQVRTSLADTPFFIADGHHRYETALAYRDWLIAESGPLAEDHPANFVMMYLSSMEDPGMVILPAHRLLSDISADQLTAFLDSIPEVFDVNTFDAATDSDAPKKFMAALEDGAANQSIGVAIRDQSILRVLTLKPDELIRRYGDEIPPALQDLDVTVLTRLIFMDLLGFDQARLDDATRIAYTSIAEDALAGIERGEHDMAFILNPTRIEQVQAVAKQRLIMPRKSTYFYPKVITGQVIYRLV